MPTSMFDVPDGDDPYNFELPEERRAREAPEQPSPKQRKDHSSNLHVYETAEKAISSHAQLKANDLRSLEEVEEELDLLTIWDKDDVNDFWI